MAEERIFFSSDDLEIEGLLYDVAGGRAAVITHPHPLYGGSMYNPVVEVITGVYQQQGYTTLRFNFRGVGASQGGYEDGQGEQQDVKAALRYLVAKNKTAIDLIGYSFGAWVNALLGAGGESLQRVIMVSPPVALIDFGAVSTIPQLRLVITGSDDDYAPPAQIRALLSRWNPGARLKVIAGADHFYDGSETQLKSALVAHLSAR